MKSENSGERSPEFFCATGFHRRSSPLTRGGCQAAFARLTAAREGEERPSGQRGNAGQPVPQRMDEIKNEMPERGAVMLNLIKKRHICGAAAANSTKVRHGMIGDRLKKAIYIEEALRITRNNLKNNGFYYCKPSSGDASTLGNALLVAQVILLLETDATNVALHVIILIICATIKINRPQTKIPTSRKSHMLIEKRAAPSDPRCDCGSYTSRSKQL